MRFASMMLLLFAFSNLAFAKMRPGEIYRGIDEEGRVCEVRILSTSIDTEMQRFIATVLINYSHSEMSAFERFIGYDAENQPVLDKDILEGGRYEADHGEIVKLYLGADQEPNVAHYFDNRGMRYLKPFVRNCIDLKKSGL